MQPRILILGSSFAGLNAAFDLKRQLGRRAEVTVMNRDTRFLFIPSLIWLVPGWRTPDDISFELAPILKRKGIGFIHATADTIDPVAKTVSVGPDRFPYDYLLIATGAHWDYDAIPGLGPHGGYTVSVGTIDEALSARDAWQALIKDPGPVVMGTAPGASCFGAEYELTFNLELALRKAGVRDRAPVTFVTPEPYIGHFGMGGLDDSRGLSERLFKGCNIEWFANTAIERITPGEVHLAGGKTLPFKFALIMPPFRGADVVRNSPGIGNARGFVPVNSRYQHTTYPDIYSAGVAVAVTIPEPTEIPTGVPKTGYMSELMAGVAAHNIAAAITGGEPEDLPFADLHALCILDAGRQGMIMATDRIFAPRQREILLSGPWSHWSKLLFEKYYLKRMRTGRNYLP